MSDDPMNSSEEAPSSIYLTRHQCVICGVALLRGFRRRIPDYLCLTHYRQWESELDKPWMQKLMNMERTRRQRVKRLLDRGINPEEVSLDAMIESGYTPVRQIE